MKEYMYIYVCVCVCVSRERYEKYFPRYEQNHILSLCFCLSLYIVIHRQICFILSELISVASWNRNPVDSNAKPKLLTI